MIEFLNSIGESKDMHEVDNSQLTYSGQQALVNLSTSVLRLSTGAPTESWFGSVCRQASLAVDNYRILGIFELVSDFISDPISEVLVSFSLWARCLYIEWCNTLLCSLNRILG